MDIVETELHKFNFPRILVDLHKNRMTGTLTVQAGDVTKRVYIDKGNAVFASSTDEDDRLGEMLIKLGKISFEQYEKSVQLLKNTGKRQGTILVELGYLTPKDLVLGVKAQVREIIYSLFQVEYADYEFDEGPLSTREVITLQMSMGNLIYEGMKRINNVARVKRDMPAMDTVLKLNEDPENFFQDIVLSQREKTLIATIDGTKTVKEIIDSSPNATFEAMRILYILCLTGIAVQQETPDDSAQHNVPQDDESPILTENDVFEERVNEFFSNLYKLSAHELLNIDSTADSETVQNNYYKLIKEFNPDQAISSSDPIMVDKMIAISEAIHNAYMLLNEDDKRRAYFYGQNKPLEGAGSSDTEEEHFRSELSRVNEEIFSPRETADRIESEEDSDGISFNGISMDEPLAFADYASEEHFEGFHESRENEEQSLHDLDDKTVSSGDPNYRAASDESDAFPRYTMEEKIRANADEEEDASSFSNERSVQEDIEALREEITMQEETADVSSPSYETRDSLKDDAKQDFRAESESSMETNKGIEEKRKHPRFRVDGCKVDGEMFFARDVKVIDMSVSGIALIVDRQLRVGKEYGINLHDDDKVITVKAEVVRSVLSETRTDLDGNFVPLYVIGMQFKDMSPIQKGEIAQFINKHKVGEVKIDTSCVLNGTRLNTRVYIDPEKSSLLDLKSCYRVKVLSLGGMLIESEQAVSLNETVQMKISLREDETVSLVGRTVSCMATESAPERFDIGVEFVDIPEEEKEKLRKFLDKVADFDREAIVQGSSDAQKAVAAETSQATMSDSGDPDFDEGFRRESQEVREIPSQDALNIQLLDLMREIKSLLSQIRAELHSVPAGGVPASAKAMKNPELQTVQPATSHEQEDIQKAIAIDDQEGSKEEYQKTPDVIQKDISQHRQLESRKEVKSAQRKEVAGRKKVKLWQILIPAFFLIAAAASFLVIYTPQKERNISQSVQTDQPKQAIKPPVQKIQESPPVPAREAKKVFPAPALRTAPHTIELIASDSTWLSATIDETSAKEMILKPGDRVRWTANKNILLVIGNAAGVKVIFNGTEISPLGGKGKVVKLQLPLQKKSHMESPQ